jgi:mitochondrial import inner membrane translocase subunit TIM9
MAASPQMGLPVPEHQQPELIRHLEEVQVRNSLKMLNVLTEKCFDKCVQTGWGGSLTSKSLEKEETTCIQNCSEKYMKVTQRAGARFAEFAANQGDFKK